MDNTSVEIFIDNGATPFILPLNMYNKHPILQKYLKTESYTPIHTGEDAQGPFCRTGNGGI